MRVLQRGRLLRAPGRALLGGVRGAVTALVVDRRRLDDLVAVRDGHDRGRGLLEMPSYALGAHAMGVQEAEHQQGHPQRAQRTRRGADPQVVSG